MSELVAFAGTGVRVLAIAAALHCSAAQAQPCSTEIERWDRSIISTVDAEKKLVESLQAAWDRMDALTDMPNPTQRELITFYNDHWLPTMRGLGAYNDEVGARLRASIDVRLCVKGFLEAQ